jgi:hypothetical protein
MTSAAFFYLDVTEKDGVLGMFERRPDAKVKDNALSS